MSRDAEGRSAPFSPSDTASRALLDSKAISPRKAPSPIAGRYDVEQLLGEGGMARVYRVFDRSTGRTHALKQLNAGASRKIATLFEGEFHTLASLRHPNIVEVFDYGVDSGLPYYTMELLEGEDLQQRAPTPWTDACAWLRVAASTLATLHARRVLHRDLSPRNLWRTPSGTIKLIDFGAVAPFGVAGDIVGTPPFVPPEALRGAPLDDRADLYALGALAHWLLTGAHAYPARSLRELRDHWALPVAPPSLRVEALQRADLPRVPAELDALVLSLLSQDPQARPASAAELIDKLDVIVGRAPEERSSDEPARFHFTKFVGRSEALEPVLARVRSGHGSSVCITGAAGLGKTRCLRELTLRARLEGALVVHAEGSVQSGEYGVVKELAARLLDALPQRAARYAGSNARTLAQLSARLRRELHVDAQERARFGASVAEARVSMQHAFCSWLCAVARDERLVIIVDDLHCADDASAAVLLELSRAAPEAPMQLVTAYRSAAGAELAPAANALLHASQRVPLAALTKAETLELLGSALGQAPNVPRLANRLHELSRGNPRDCLRLAEHLVASNVIAYADGAWVIPPAIADQDLPKTSEGLVSSRVAALGPEVRALAEVLSVGPSPIGIELCAGIAELPPARLFVALSKLVSLGILNVSGSDYYFVDADVRAFLAREFEPARAQRAHLAIGDALLARGELSTLERLQAAVHLLQAGDTKRGIPVACASALRIALQEGELLSAAVPLLERALPLLVAAGAPSRQTITVLALLARAGLFHQYRLGFTYGDQALLAFRRVLCLDWARRLRPFFGGKLSVLMCLTAASLALGLRSGEGIPTLRQVITLFTISVGALCGMATICVDPERVLHYASVLEPLAAMGRDHLFGFMHEYCSNLALTVRDQPSTAYERWRELLDRLRRPEGIRDFPMVHHQAYFSGALYACGALESYRDAALALTTAEALDALNTPFAAMSAEKIRMLYYANQGNTALYEHHRRCLEAHAIQQGTAWQVEAWAPGAAIMVYLRTHDAIGMKQELKQLQRVAHDLPSLRIYEERALGTYLLLRGQAEQALPHLEACTREPRQAVAGWARAHGALARAYNALGRHEDARRTCLSVLEHLTHADQMFTAMNLLIQTELAVAESGLGEHAMALRRLDDLLARHMPDQSPISLGHIYEARLQLAERASDHRGIVDSLEQMEQWYRRTTAPALIARCERTRRRLAGHLGDPRSSSTDDVVTVDACGSIAAQDDVPPSEALEALLAACNAVYGFVLYASEPAPRGPAHARESIDQGLVRWAEVKLEAALDQATDAWDGSGQPAIDVHASGNTQYRFYLVQNPDNDVEILGAVVAGQAPGSSGPPPISKLRVLARAMLAS